jgi:hypothetical protein
MKLRTILFNVVGFIGALYACIELIRWIYVWAEWRKVWLIGYYFEVPLVALGGVLSIVG